MSLVPDHRIKKTREFREVLAKGRKVEGEYLRVYFYVKEQSADGRLGVSVRRSLGSAVARNRSKRLVREAFRLHGSQLPPGADLIVAVTKNLSGMKLKEVEGIFLGMVAKLGLICETRMKR